MFKFTPLILKTIWRHRSRTLLTAGGTAVAMFVFCFVGAVQHGMDALHHRQQEKRSLIAFQANKFCPATSHLPQDYGETIAKMSGVRDVVPIQVFTNNCRASLDVVVFYGLPAEKIRTARDFRMLYGSFEEFEQHQKAAIVGRAVATRGDRNLGVGDLFAIGDVEVTVAGIYSSDDPGEENYVYTHLDFLQRNKGFSRVGTVTQFEVLLDASTDPMQICRQIDETFRSGSVETDTRPKGVFQAKSLGDLTELIGMAHYLGYACVGLVLALVATTTVMSVQDRIQQHAVMQTLGFSMFTVFRLVLIESTLLSLLGGAAGVGIATAVLHYRDLAIGAEAVTIAFTPSFSLASEGMLVALVAGVLAGGRSSLDCGTH